MNDFSIPNDREDFVKTWLTESPMGIPAKDYAQSIKNNIRDIVNTGYYSPTYIGKNGLQRIEMKTLVYYWYGELNNFLLGAEFSIAPQALIVNFIGKTNKGQPPYASDLYDAVLHDMKNLEYRFSTIKISSDDKLSEEGLGIWKKLLQKGHKIMIYDSSSDVPGQTQIRITSEEELNNFFKMNDPSFGRYRYVVSESKSFSDLIGIFNTRRMRELHEIL